MILRYPGSKEKAGRDLMSLAPASYCEFRDPFCGNATMLWFVPTDKRRWVNDIDPDVTRFLRHLKRNPNPIIRKRARLLGVDATTMQREFRLDKFRWMVNNDMASYWYLRRVAFGQYVTRYRADICSFGHHHRRNGIQACTPEKVKKAHSILQGVKITTLDYSALLDAPGDDVWVFLDPPYIVNHHSSRLYSHELTLKQHCELAERLRVCKHRFLLTIGYCSLTQDLYCRPCFNWSFRSYKYGNVPRPRQPDVSELIVTNY